MKSFSLVVALTSLMIGYSHRAATEAAQDKLVRVEGVVEEYDPEALVFYDPKGLPYDARSRVSRVRVTAPSNLAGRFYSIDLLSANDGKEEAFDDLRRPGAIVRFMLYSTLTSNTERQMIPVYELKKEPNQAPEPTAPSGRGSS